MTAAPAFHTEPPHLSAAMTRAHALLRELRPTPGDVRTGRDVYTHWAEQFPIPTGTTIEPLGEHAGLVVTGPSVTPRRTVIHLHGGGFMVGSPTIHREMASRLSSAAEARVYLLDYPLAPEQPFPAAPDFVFAFYRRLLADGVDPSTVVISGDSAGGTLTLLTLERCRAEGVPLPAAAVPLSPCVDLSLSGATMTTHTARDPMLSRELLVPLVAPYLAGHGPRDPRISPLFGDPAGLPPLLIQVGSEEVLVDDAVRMSAAAAGAGVDVTLRVIPGAPHIVQHFASFLPEASAAIDEYGQFVRAHTQK